MFSICWMRILGLSTYLGIRSFPITYSREGWERRRITRTTMRRRSVSRGSRSVAWRSTTNLEQVDELDTRAKIGLEVIDLATTLDQVRVDPVGEGLGLHTLPLLTLAGHRCLLGWLGFCVGVRVGCCCVGEEGGEGLRRKPHRSTVVTHRGSSGNLNHSVPRLFLSARSSIKSHRIKSHQNRIKGIEAGPRCSRS